MTPELEPSVALRRAIHAKLQSNSEVTTIFGANIADYIGDPNKNLPLPYLLYAGASVRVDKDVSCGNIYNITQPVIILHQDQGFKRISEAMWAVYNTLLSGEGLDEFSDYTDAINNVDGYNILKFSILDYAFSGKDVQEPTSCVITIFSQLQPL